MVDRTEALAALSRVSARIKRLEQDRAALFKAAAQAGAAQTELMAATGLSREEVRRKERAAGLPPRPRGGHQRRTQEATDLRDAA